MRPFLCGLETEFSVSSAPRPHRPTSYTPEQLITPLFRELRQQNCFLPDAGAAGGLFLENGARVYPEIHGHPEYATPECLTPMDAALYDKVGERVLHRATLATSKTLNVPVRLVKSSIGCVHPDRVTFGAHESYLFWGRLDEAAHAMIPHLVTRLPYCGAGCLSAFNDGMGFELSQRARHMTRVIGSDTTNHRALFCTRLRKSSDFSKMGWVRAHLISKDAQRSPFGSYLTVGITGLMFHILSEGGTLGEGLTLREPLQALRMVSSDPWLRAPIPLDSGRALTALEIQRLYLIQCERQAKKLPMPTWADEVLHYWRWTLDQLAEDPFLLAPRLDAYLKLYLYDHEIKRAGLDWTRIHCGLDLQARLRATFSDRVVYAIIARDPALAGEETEAYQRANAEMVKYGPDAHEHLSFVLRLQAIEMQLQELGGLYDQLDQQHQVEPVIYERGAIDHAMTNSPQGRPALRGAHIRAQHGNNGWVCDWTFVLHRPTRTFLDMRNPFEVNPALRSLGPEDFEDFDEHSFDILSLIASS